MFSFVGMWYPSVGALPIMFNPLERMAREYSYTIQFLERQPGRFLDVYMTVEEEDSEESSFFNDSDTDYQPGK